MIVSLKCNLDFPVSTMFKGKYSTGFKKIEKINATVFAVFKNVAHSLEPGETPSY